MPRVLTFLNSNPARLIAREEAERVPPRYARSSVLVSVIAGWDTYAVRPFDDSEILAFHLVPRTLSFENERSMSRPRLTFLLGTPKTPPSDPLVSQISGVLHNLSTVPISNDIVNATDLVQQTALHEVYITLALFDTRNSGGVVDPEIGQIQLGKSICIVDVDKRQLLASEVLIPVYVTDMLLDEIPDYSNGNAGRLRSSRRTSVGTSTDIRQRVVE